MSAGWQTIAEDKRPLIEDAMRTLDHAKVPFVLMVFTLDGAAGAILSNIDPRQAIGPLEAALRAAKADVEVDPIPETGPRVQ